MSSHYTEIIFTLFSQALVIRRLALSFELNTNKVGEVKVSNSWKT